LFRNSTEEEANESEMRQRITMTNVVLAPMARVSATLGDLAGTTPSSGTARHYATDHLGSTRSAWDGSKASVGAYEFTPYGSEYGHTGAAIDTLAGAYTGKPWDATAGFFHFPYRQYSPDMARWTSRDPLGMVDGPNVSLYVGGSPLNRADPLGLFGGPYPTDYFINRPRTESCRAAARRIQEETEHEFPWHSGETFAENFMRHCVGICRLTRAKGRCCAFVAGRLGEFRPPFGPGEFARDDIEANAHGRSCGSATSKGSVACCRQKADSMS